MAIFYGHLMRLPNRFLIIIPIVCWLTVGPVGSSWAAGFSLIGVSNRFITPNGDNKNDVAIFAFNNLALQQVTGKIYDIHGRFVADMVRASASAVVLGQGCADVNSCQQWDGKANGQTVHTGVYIYVVTATGASYSGVVVVIR